MQSKVKFIIRLSAWLCLIPASLDLFLFQTVPTSMRYLFLFEIIIAAVFAAYLLLQANNKKTITLKSLFNEMIFSLIFVSIVVFIPLLIAYLSLKRSK